MTLSAIQVQSVKFHLGYASGDMSVDVELSYLTPEGETKVVELLTRLDAIDAKLASDVVDAAGIHRVSSIEFFEGQAITDLGSLRSEWLSRLSSLTKLPNKNGTASNIPFSYLSGLGICR